MVCGWFCLANGKSSAKREVNMLELVRILFGSHLYGTANENSDLDYKGIFLPSKEDLLLGRLSKSINLSTNKSNAEKNSADDVDVELYSLHYFIHLACEGETVALDMLHAPKEFWELNTTYKDPFTLYGDIWKDLVRERERFYTKNLKAFVGYARRQASKYGVKGSRMNAAESVLRFLESQKRVMLTADFRASTLGTMWNLLPSGEHIHKYEDEIPSIYEVCGRKLQRTVTLAYAYDVVRKFYNAYGERAKMAATNEGIDWKAVSHALRAAYQTREILQDGTIIFPLKNADYLKAVKEGKVDYLTDVAPTLDTLMDEVEELSAKSTLPEKVDRNYWNIFIINTMESYVL